MIHLLQGCCRLRHSMSRAVACQRGGRYAQRIELRLHQLGLSGIQTFGVFILVCEEIVGIMEEERGCRGRRLNGSQSALLAPFRSCGRHESTHARVFIRRGQGTLIVEHARAQDGTLHLTALVGITSTGSIFVGGYPAIANSQRCCCRTTGEACHHHIAIQSQAVTYATHGTDGRLHLAGSIGVDLDGSQTLVGTTRILALSPVAILGMVAHSPGEANSRGSLDEAVFELPPEIGQVHACVLVVGGVAAAIGEAHHHGNGMRGVGGIDQVQIERVASRSLVVIRIVVHAGVVLIVRDVTLDAVALHQDIGTRRRTADSTEPAVLQTAVDGDDVLVQRRRHSLLAPGIVELYHLPALLAQPRHIVGIRVLTNLLETEVLQIHYRHRLPAGIGSRLRGSLRGGIVDSTTRRGTGPLPRGSHRHIGCKQPQACHIPHREKATFL